MTTPFTTPTVWLAHPGNHASRSLLERIAPFAEGHDLQELNGSGPSRLLHDVGQHATAWMVVYHNDDQVAVWQDLARQCREINDCFRCLVIGAPGTEGWPEDSLFLPAAALSTTIIDRLRVESHALRMTSTRRRHIARLMGQRP